MNQDERLSGALQENILCLLCFDDRAAKMIRGSVTPQLFESSVFREVVGHAIDFLDQYGEAIKDHLPDHLEGILKGEDQRKAKTYSRLLENLYLSKDSVNADYVISQLHKFVRMQTFKAGLLRAVEAVEDGRIDEAEVYMNQAMEKQVAGFEPGLSLSSPEAVASILDFPEEEGFELGIPELDNLGIIPRRKELYMLLAPRGKGKSWFLTHCAKRALLARWCGLVITLEMSERRYAVRVLQAFFSISRRSAEVTVTRLAQDRDGNLDGMIQEVLTRKTLRDDDIRKVLITKAKREFGRRSKFKIKEFPSGSLTLAGLNAYLDGLERFENFIPDVIMIDYPDLMEVDSKNLRLDLSKLIVGIRGIGVKRNAAMIVVSQGNRESETATTVTGAMAAEDISKIATADNVLTYSQTPAEQGLGLARLLVEKARNEESKSSVLITQAYAIGQFCLDSVRLKPQYWNLMEDRSERKQDDPPAARRSRPRRGQEEKD